MSSSVEPLRDHRPTGMRFLVMIALCVAVAIIYIQRSAISVAAPTMQKDLGLSEAQMGLVMSGFFWAYALAQIPSGWMGQTWGSRRMLTLSVGLASLLCLAMAWADGFASLLLVWVLAGVAVAGVIPCGANTFAQWFPANGRALPTGIFGSAMSIGAIVAMLVSGALLGVAERRDAALGEVQETPGSDSVGEFGYLIDWIDWRFLFALYAVPGILWAVWFFRWFRDQPSEHSRVNAAELALIAGGTISRPDGAMPVPVKTKSLARTMTSLPMLLIYGQQFFRAAGYVFYQTWFPTYLKERYGVATGMSGYLTSLPLIGVVLGGFVGGPLIDAILRRTGSRRLSWQLVGAVSQFVCGGLVLAAWFITDSVSAVLTIALGSFVFSFGNCCAAVATIDLAGAHVATVYSAMNMAGNLGAATCPLVVGWLVQQAGWDPVLLLFAGIYLLAGLCWTVLNPNARPVP